MVNEVCNILGGKEFQGVHIWYYLCSVRALFWYCPDVSYFQNYAKMCIKPISALHCGFQEVCSASIFRCLLTSHFHPKMDDYCIGAIIIQKWMFIAFQNWMIFVSIQNCMFIVFQKCLLPFRIGCILSSRIGWYLWASKIECFLSSKSGWYDWTSKVSCLPNVKCGLET